MRSHGELTCVSFCRDVLSRMTHLVPDGVRLECLSLLSDMTQSAHAYLLSPVHKVLKVSVAEKKERARCMRESLI